MNRSSFSIRKMPVFYKGDALQDREKAYEKEYIQREEAKRIKKLRKSLKDKKQQAEEYFYISEEIDVETVLEDREWLIRTLTENGIPQNENLLKKLLKWKHD